MCRDRAILRLLLQGAMLLAIVSPLPFQTIVSLAHEDRAMSRCLALVSTGVLLLCAAIGCPLHSFLGSTGVLGEKSAVAAPYTEVAATLETGLNDKGISVLTKRLDGEIRLAGRTKSGEVFCLDVKRAKGEKTVVSVRWDQKPDEQFWQTVVELLKAPPPEREDSAER
jgi:hypothetical protein